MIVKNEAARIVRALDSAVQFLSAAVIVDTGSTDDTKNIITSYFEHHNLPCRLSDAPFLNWSQARNAALNAARYARRNLDFDYMLLMDADMELQVFDVEKFLADRDGLSYDMEQRTGALHYLNRRLIRWDAPGEYVGVTHEYLDVGAAGLIEPSIALFKDNADGANRPNKYKRDIQLLKEGLRVEPTNARYMFYLAQSYRDAGQPEKAIKWYRRRIAAGGWDEEVWNAQANIANCYKDMKDEARYVHEMLIAYNMRPSRAETVYDLAHFYRHKGMNAAGCAMAEVGMSIPYTQDALFVNDYAHTVGCKEEFAICGFYVPERKEKAFQVCNDLTLSATPHAGARELARLNMYFYLPRLQDMCPSFRSQPISWAPPDGWNALNPSITGHEDSMVMNIRTVNYKIDEHGRYCRYLDGEWKYHDDWETYPIRTRNYLARVHDNLSCDPVLPELLPPSNMPDPVFKPVLGFEDVRLYSWSGDLWTSSTVREMAADGLCEQVRARVSDCCQLTQWTKMLRTPRLYEKNWAPLVDGETLRFVYRLGEMVDNQGQTTHLYPTGLATDHISGGSQYIPFMVDFWLGLVHEARCLPNSQQRYYQHRFVLLTKDFRVARISLPFVFDDKLIEFAAGLCDHPNGEDLVISYGYRDREARLGSVKKQDVAKFLWQPSK